MKIRRNRFTLLCIIFLAAAVLFSCVSNHPVIGNSSEDAPALFKNNSGHEGPALAQVIAWRFKRLWRDNSNNGAAELPAAQIDIARLHQPGPAPQLTWIGHATLLLQMDDINILTDPHFTDTASPVSWAGPKRVAAAAVSLDELPPIDIVVISHNHYDHLDKASVEYIYQHKARGAHKTHFYVPRGLKSWFVNLGIEDVTDLNWWQSAHHGEWVIHATPVHHHSGRGLWDKNETLWSGWALKRPGFSFFFAGDTGYSTDFADIGRRLGPFDLAAIPIGGYAPKRLMSAAHVSPEDAVQIHRDVRSRHSVAIHWGTFAELTDEPIDEPPKRLRQALVDAQLPEDVFSVYQHGETRTLATQEN